MPLTVSERCQHIAPSVTLAIDARAKEMVAQGIDVIGFGAGEPDFDTPEYIRDAAKYALDHGMTRYTPVSGTLALRKEIAQKFERDNGLKYAPNEIIVSSGAKQSLFTALSAIVNPGDEVLIPGPYWVSYPEMVHMVGGVSVCVMGGEEDDFVVSAERLRPFVTEKTKALILNSPNNPNGSVWPREALEGLAALAVEKGFCVISDEIYEKMVYDGKQHVSIASLGEAIKAQTITVNGASKTYAMTGWRIGYAAGPKAIISAMENFQSHAASNPNSIAQYATQVALTGGEQYLKDMLAEFDARRRLIHRLVNDIPGLRANLPAGAFYLMVNIEGVIGKKYKGRLIDGSMAFAEAILGGENVAVVPAKAFGDDMYLRLSYAVSREKIEKGVSRIKKFVSELEG